MMKKTYTTIEQAARDCQNFFNTALTEIQLEALYHAYRQDRKAYTDFTDWLMNNVDRI